MHRENQKLDRTVTFCFIMLILVLFMATIYKAKAHEHMAGESTEQARVIEFYKTWHRPKGDFSMTHRVGLCCYAGGDSQDCFPVLAQRTNEKGIIEVTPDVSGATTMVQARYGGKWWPLIHNIEEDKQPDPRESPDGRSHMCVTDSVVLCYVAGAGN